MDHNEQVNISTLLEEENATCLEFLDILNKEKEALEDLQLSSLEKILNKKKSITYKLEQLNVEKCHVLTTLGYTPNSSGLINYLGSLGDHCQLISIWNNTKQLLSKCAAINVINGRIIAISHQQTKRLVSMLFANSGDVAIYDANGSAQTQFNADNITKA